MECLDADKLSYTVYKPLSNPEDDLMELLRRKCEIEEMIEYCKDCIREEQQRLKDAFAMGGIQADEQYPEYLDPEKLVYWQNVDFASLCENLTFAKDGSPSEPYTVNNLYSLNNENPSVSTESEFNLFPEFK